MTKLTPKRIEYIDLMKGICIILIILLHNQIYSSNENINDILKNMRIPLYFCLSGLFFKEYNGFYDFITRKFNKLIIPFIFFAYFPFALCEIGLNYERSIKTYLLMSIEPYNYPLWFLRCLFVTYILYFLFHKITKRLSLAIQTISIFLIAFFSYTIIHNLTLPNNIVVKILENSIFNIITAFIALPFFHIASIVRRKGFLSQNISNKYIIVLFIIFFFIWTLTFQNNIDYRTIQFGKNFVFLYASALGGTGCVWCIAYVIKKMFYISYIGRYSLIALGTHYPLILLFNSIGIHNKYIVFLCILIVMPGVIYIFKKYFPYMTAQKDLFVYKDGKLKLSINLFSKDHQ